MLYGEISIIPDAFWTIEKLEIISGNCGYVKIGHCIHRNQSLRNLYLLGWAILPPPRLPESLISLYLTYLYVDVFPELSNLTNLQVLELGFGRVCTDGPLEDPVPVVNPLPRWLGNLTKLRSLDLRFDCPTASTIDDPSLPPQLESLHLTCPDLCRLPRLPSSLSSLDLYNCRSLSSIEDLSNLNELSSLKITGAAITEIQGLGCSENLQDLALHELRQVKILPDLSNLNKLSGLEVRYCDNLVEIQGELPEYMNELSIYSCGSLEKLPDLSGLKELQTIYIGNCTKLIVEAISGFAWRSQEDLWENLRYLHIGDLEQVEILPDLSYLSKLWSLEVDSCRNLAEIQGELPQSLEELKISACESLQKLPDLSSLKNLEQLYIRRCTTLKGKAILGSAQRSQANLWENLLYLGICDLGQVKILPDLSASNKLRHLRVSNCGKLVEVQSELPQSLKKLEISSCESLQKLPDLSSLKVEEVEISSCGSLKNLDDLSFSFGPQIVVIVGCQKLNVEAILGSARKSQANLSENLRYLQICGFGQVKALPDLHNLNKLRCLQVEKCPSLVEIQGELPQSLEELEISSCGSLQRLPDLSSLKGLQKVVMKGCMQLNVEAIYRLCLERSVKFVGYVDELE
ncbi:probable disease resistance protein RPP1 [Eucalyptus grandis]|uniref:probable disease resistance protein RPP1 n=1 Tax=Eucalyptus grandis TaxID=71139 RepID=UPI00192F0734|nr:probable disease resistance protein RPP1 [Eucalyptus grandis]